MPSAAPMSKIDSTLLVSLSIAMAMVGCVSPPAANRALGLAEQPGQLEKAWKMVSRELRDHPERGPLGQRCELRGATVMLLHTIYDRDFVPANADEIVLKAYRYVREHCLETKSANLIENNVFQWFYKTRRPAKSLPYGERALEGAATLYDRCLDLGNLGASHSSLGNLAMKERYYTQAIETCRRHFANKRTYRYASMENREYGSFATALRNRRDVFVTKSLEHGLSPEERAEAAALWAEEWEIMSRWGSFGQRAAALGGGVYHFARMRDFEKAEALHTKLDRYLTRTRESDKPLIELDLLGSGAMIEYMRGNHTSAAEMMRQWVENFHRVSGKKIDGRSLRLAGLAQEAAGDYDNAINFLGRAVDLHQQERRDWNIERRGRVFQEVIATAYWGLMRSHVKRYLRSGNPEDVDAAIEVGRLMRSRQLTESLHAEIVSLDAVQDSLRPGELALEIYTTDQAIITFAFARGEKHAAIQSIPLAELHSEIESVRAQTSRPRSEPDVESRLQRLSAHVFGELQPLLARYESLVVLPDGPVAMVPMALLSGSAAHYRPLVETHTISYAPSLSLLAESRRHPSRLRDGPLRLLAVADPAYPQEFDTSGFDEVRREAAERAVSDLGFFEPLPETRREVRTAARLLGSGDATFLMGTDATESAVKHMDLLGYDVLHFATHGVLGQALPGVYEPALVMAADESEADGYLSLTEVAQLELDSDLTVLSACDTGRGEYVRGEGVMGLGRGFMAAGSRSVLVSLWPIASEATVQFMEVFYGGLAAGQTKADALRQAQMAIRSAPRATASGDRGLVAKKPDDGSFADPYYWAPFILIGDDA